MAPSPSLIFPKTLSTFYVCRLTIRMNPLRTPSPLPSEASAVQKFTQLFRCLAKQSNLTLIAGTRLSAGSVTCLCICAANFNSTVCYSVHCTLQKALHLQCASYLRIPFDSIFMGSAPSSAYLRHAELSIPNLCIPLPSREQGVLRRRSHNSK